MVPTRITRIPGTPTRHLSLAPLVVSVASLAYALLLQWSYMTVEGVVGYAATQIADVEGAYLLVGFGLVALVPLLLPFRIQRPSHLALWVLYLTWYVPSMLFTYHVGQLDNEHTFRFLLLVTAAFVALILICRTRPLGLPHVTVNHTTFVLVVGVITLVLTGIVLTMLSQTGAESLIQRFVLDDVYTRRAVAREVAPGRSFIGYLLSTLISSFAPITLVYGFLTKRRGFTVLGVAGLVSVFMFDGTKGNLFVPLLFVVFVALARRPHWPFGLCYMGGLAAIVATSVMLYSTADNTYLSTHVVRRAIVARGTTLGVYFELFDGSPMYMKDSSIATWFGERQLDKGFQVGQAYGGGVEENWAGNSWAAMFADFGIPGLFIASLLMGVILLFYDGAVKNAPFALVATMAGYTAHIWGDAAVTSSILTNGVLVTLIILNHFGATPSTAIPPPMAPKLRSDGSEVRLRPRPVRTTG